MEKSSSIAAISKAIVAVMKEVVGIDKSMTVGSGNNSYKGVSDKDVKNIIGKAMEKFGLCIIPVDVDPTLQIDRWVENSQYGDKQKQQVFTSVKTKYLLLHESGEYMEVMGYGHGVDSQDKAAGKATTYALKYALLYTFMVPTGKIDDADAEHSDEREMPPVIQQKKTAPQPVKKTLTDKAVNDAAARIINGEVELYEKLTSTIALTEGQLKVLDVAKSQTNKAA